MSQFTIPEALQIGFELARDGELDSAVEVAEEVLKVRAEEPDALLLLAVVADRQGRVADAVQLIQRAITSAPDRAGLYEILGSFLRRDDKLPQATAAYEKAIALAPGFVPAISGLGALYLDTREWDRGILLLKRAIAINGSYLPAQLNLANAYYQLGDYDHAELHYREILKFQPDHLRAVSNLGNVCKQTGRVPQAIALYRQAVELEPRAVINADNLLLALHYDPDSDRPRLFAECQDWHRRIVEPEIFAIAGNQNDRDPQRRLRIGYVSPDLGAHPIGFFMQPLLASHDREGFEVFCYSQLRFPDSMTKTLESLSDHWREIFGKTDQQVIEMIRRDRIDILVNLALHTARNRLMVFARKPAPVQVTYLGYAGGTGLKSIDYRLTDRYLDPDPAHDQWYLEKSVRLDGSYWCYQPESHGQPVTALPALTHGHLTFCCLNNFSKVSQAALELWANILKSVWESRLMLHCPRGSCRGELLAFMGARGISFSRIELVDRTNRQDYFGLYRRADIALDPFPFCGGTTTCDALWMGVPVVTLAGRTAVGRAGVSILSNLGMPELVAQTPGQYRLIATSLAGNLEKLSELRSTLRQRMADSRLMDRLSYTQSIESAYRTMWREWCHS